MDSDARSWLEYLTAARGASPHTLRAYRGDLRSLASYLQRRRPDRRLRDASRRELRGWLASLGSVDSRLAPASLARRVATLRSFYGWMVREGRLEQSPAARIRPPRVARRVPRLLEVPEAAVVVENPPQKGILALRNRALLELLYGAGLRISELVSLDRVDVDCEERLVRVRDGKGGKDRIVPFGPPAAAAIDALVRNLSPEGLDDTPALFRNHRGGRLGVRSARRIVKQAGDEAGVDGVHPHALRHACATHMLSGGADLPTIQKQLGHESLATTERYTHVDPAHLLRVYRGAHPRARGGSTNDEEDGA